MKSFRNSPQRSKLLSMSNVVYALLTVVALVMFMQDAQAVFGTA